MSATCSPAPSSSSGFQTAAVPVSQNRGDRKGKEETIVRPAVAAAATSVAAAEDGQEQRGVCCPTCALPVRAKRCRTVSVRHVTASTEPEERISPAKLGMLQPRVKQTKAHGHNQKKKKKKRKRKKKMQIQGGPMVRRRKMLRRVSVCACLYLCLCICLCACDTQEHRTSGTLLACAQLSQHPFHRGRLCANEKGVREHTMCASCAPQQTKEIRQTQIIIRKK